jgi:RNA polymerase sigma factor (sigma-70 family)
MTRGHTRLLATQTDERLLELVQQGHERAFEAIVVRHRRALLAYCRHLGLSDSRAEDALQQALLKAWLALEGGAEVRALRPWLYRIVHNAAVNVIRSSKDELALEPDVALVELLAVPDSGLDNAGAARQALTHVAALPSMQRDAILLSAIDGRSHEEVARALGISSGAVRGLLYRARTALRAAAAALTPAPLITWASGTAGRAAPTAGRLAELTGATGGAEVGGALLKGAAVAGSALLAAGVVFGPLHGRAAPDRGRLALPSASANGAVESPTTDGHASTTSASSQALTRAANAAPAGVPVTRTGTSPPTVTVVTPATGRSGSPAVVIPAPPSAAAQTSPTSMSSAPATATAAATTSSTSTGGQTGGGEVPGGSAGGSGGGSSGGSETEGKHSESFSDDGSEGEDGGHGEDSGGSDGAEHKREAASERAEREAEAIRERAEREAEIAREHEHHGAKDS